MYLSFHSFPVLCIMYVCISIGVFNVCPTSRQLALSKGLERIILD